MIPKACKSQFRTPFRGRPINVRSPLSRGPLCPEPPLAETPSAVLACSQFSTPGITIDAIKTMIRRSPVRATTTRNNDMRLKPPSKKSKKSESATAILNREQSKRNQSKVRKVPVEETIDGNKPRNIRTATKVTGSECDVLVVLQDKGIQRFEQADHRMSVCSLSNDTPTKTGGARTSHAISRVKKNIRSNVQKTLQKYYPANSTASTFSYGDVKGDDEVVVVNENAFVYKEHNEEVEAPAVPKDPNHDVYNFYVDSPDGHLESKRAKKEQVRLQVLKNIYKIETELAVFRYRRHKLRAKIMKGPAVEKLTLTCKPRTEVLSR